MKTLKQLWAVCLKCKQHPIHPLCVLKVEGEWAVCRLREDILCKQREERERRKREGLPDDPIRNELERRAEENTKRLKELIVRDKEELERLELKRQIEELNEITKRLKEQLYS